MTRVFYWLHGVPKDRIGGPWWARSFENDVKGQEFAKYISDVCRKVKIAVYNIGDEIPEVDHQLVEPPDHAKELQ